MRGCFITFEGVEGCGKSTQIARLEAYLSARGYRVTATREPGGTAIAERVRELILEDTQSPMEATTELMLYAAARAEHVHKVILPALHAGHVVLCDRFVDSTLAYQGQARGLGFDVIRQLHAFSATGLWPARTYLLDLPEEEGLERARKRGRTDRLEKESLAFHEQVRFGFLQLAREALERITILDGRMAVEALSAHIAHDADALLANHELERAPRGGGDQNDSP